MYLLSIILAVTTLWAQDKNLTYDVKAIKKTNKDITLEFTPPASHHFNMEAPSSIILKSKSEDKKVSMDKKASGITVVMPNLSDCEIQAQLYLCDDKNTYCIPVKRKYSCADFSNEGKNVTGQAQAIDVVIAKPSGHEKLNFFILNEPQKALEKAKAEKKPLMIDFFGVWCPPCNMLDETVFTSRQFESVKKDFVFLKLDADDPVSWELKAKYNVKGYPTVIIANPAGEEISRIVGSRNAKMFVNMLKNSLKYKNMTLAERIAKADSLNSPAAAELAEMYLNAEDFENALKYYTIASKSWAANDPKRNKLMSAQLGVLEKTAEKNQKFFADMLETALQLFPYGAETVERTDKLVKVADDLKDEALKKRAYAYSVKNADYLLKHPGLLENSEVDEPWLYYILADAAESQGNEKLAKENFLKVFDSYTRQIKKEGLNEKTERGMNLERIYALHKAGQSEKASQMYEELEKVYPEEFTFYHNHASVLKEMQKLDKAMEKAELAYKYSYGDNQLRAVHNLASIQGKLGKKREAISLLEKTIKNAKLPNTDAIRTGRYVEKLKTLLETTKKL